MNDGTTRWCDSLTGYSVSVGEVRGDIHQGLSWSGGPYTLYGVVTEQSGATLAIASGTTVRSVDESKFTN